MGILYCLYKKNFSKRSSLNLYKKSVHKIQNTKQDYIGQRHEIYINILASLYSKIRGQDSGINRILPANKQLNKEIKLDTRAVFKTLY